MARTGWFETVAEAQRRAKKRLPSPSTARWSRARRSGLTVDDNTRRVRRTGLRPARRRAVRASATWRQR